MEYRVLGSLEVLHEGEPVNIGPRQQRALLALLIANNNRVVSTERILEELWRHDVEGKEKTLWVYISRLRTALEPNRQTHAKSSVLVTRDHGYTLVLDRDQLDSHLFEKEATRGRDLVRDDPIAAAEILETALGRWRGKAYEDFEYDEFAQSEISRLDESRLAATEDLLDARLRSGSDRDVIGELEELVRDHPLRERPIGLLMVALYRSGRQAESLRAFQNYRRTVGEELGIDPSPELCRIEEQVLLHDERLDAISIAPEHDDRAEHRNPFKGLQAFTSEDAGLFFGRDRLVSDIIRRISGGVSLVSLIGASGSGKSSVLRAGLIPAMRKGAVGDPEVWRFATMFPGARPFTELETALLRTSLDTPDSLAELLDHPEEGLLRAALRLLPEYSGRLLLVIDQFEELFTLVTSEEVRNRFIRNLEVALGDPHHRIVIVIALRADFYDRPLEHATFARVLGDGIVNTVPLTPDELEAAAEKPAAIVGVQFEATLLARLLTDVAGQKGGLPLFQYALTELFDRRVGSLLTAQAYEEMGGVSGAISRRAEDVYQDLDADQQAATKQLFLRLVTIADGAAWSRRRVPASEIVSIADDIVDLQTLLEAFGSYRLLTFDRDYTAGSSTVEVAHEALLFQWARLRGWIEEGREDVLRHAYLATALTEWRASGEKEDYLLSGERLADYEQWAEVSTLRPNTDERRFLDASIARRERSKEVDALRTARESKLDRQAKRRLVGMAAALGLVVVVVAGALVAALGGSAPRIAVVHGVTGDFGVNDLMLAGSSAAERQYDITIERVRPLVDPVADLKHLAETGVDLIIVSSDFDFHIDAVAADFPEVHFVAIDPVGVKTERPNITTLHFSVEESAFLAGAAAAMKSEAGTIGFIGGVQRFPVERSRTGFEQGARFQDPNITVLSRYLGPVENPWATANTRPDLARELAMGLFSQGADVIFYDAGESGVGIVAAAREAPSSHHLWVIGSDVDAYQTTSSSIDRAHILSSSVKRYDTAVVRSIGAFLEGSLEPGDIVLGLNDDGIGLSRSGGHLNDIDGYLRNLEGEVSIGHVAVYTNSLVAPEWQRGPDLTIRLEMSEAGCIPDVVGDSAVEDQAVRIEPGKMVLFEYTNATDSVGSIALHTVTPGVTLVGLIREAEFGFPTSFDMILGVSNVEPGARTAVAAVMDRAPIVANCSTDEMSPDRADFPALIVKPAR